jgi:hypothetical protein
MSEEHAEELMTNVFPTCPICKSAGDYVLSPSKTVIQCNHCKAKFFSHDFQNPQSDLNTLGLFTAPTAIVNETVRTGYKSLELRELPLDFWKEISKFNDNMTHSEFRGLVAKYRKEEPEDATAALWSAALPKLLDSCPICGAKMSLGGLRVQGSRMVSVWWGYWSEEKVKIKYDRIGGFFGLERRGLRCTNCKTLLVQYGEAPVLGLKTLSEIKKTEEGARLSAERKASIY